MRRRPIRVENMNDQYLLALFRTGKMINYNLVINEIKRRLNKKGFTYLLYKWSKEENEMLKELFELAIANKISAFFPNVSYEELSEIMKEYLEKVSSVEALCILLQSNTKAIVEKSKERYCEFLDTYLSETEDRDFNLYKTEGDDTAFLYRKQDTKIIPFPIDKIKMIANKEKRKVKVYKFNKENKNEGEDRK